MMSSGQSATSTIRCVECDGTMRHTLPAFADGPRYPHEWPCTFAGNVDVQVDPEVNLAYWDCPRCGTRHDMRTEIFA